MGKEDLIREMIIRKLVEDLQPLDYVDAFWEAGAIAFGRVDKWSDIDLYLVVDDNRVKDAFLAVERSLKSLSPIERKFEPLAPPGPGIFQAFYKLARANEFLLIDLAIIQRSGEEKFLEPEIHGNALFHFNKFNRINIPQTDKDALVKRVLQRKERLEARMDMFNNYTPKEINRNNLIEAIHNFHYLTLGSLLEALRMKYNPFHSDFMTRYVHYELPRDVLQRLQRLYFVKDGQDLQDKYVEATNWFYETVSNIDRSQLEQFVKRR